MCVIKGWKCALFVFLVVIFVCGIANFQNLAQKPPQQQRVFLLLLSFASSSSPPLLSLLLLSLSLLQQPGWMVVGARARQARSSPRLSRAQSTPATRSGSPSTKPTSRSTTPVARKARKQEEHDRLFAESLQQEYDDKVRDGSAQQRQLRSRTRRSSSTPQQSKPSNKTRKEVGCSTLRL